MSYVVYPAVFNGNDITQVPGLTVLASDPYKPADRTLNIYELTEQDDSKLNSAFYKKKRIALRVGISRTTRDLVEQSLDILLNLLQGKEKELQVRQSGATRSYKCSYSNYEILESGGSYLEINLIFECSDPFGYEVITTLLLQITNYTSANKTDLVNVGGSAPTQVPTLTYTYTSLTGGTSKTVTIGNGTTGQSISINRTWMTGDVIQIDCKNETIKVNGLDVVFTGSLLDWGTGVQYITYSDNFATRSFNAIVVYNKRYV